MARVPTIKASELVLQLQSQIKDMGDLPIFITDHDGHELPIRKDCVRFTAHVGALKDRKSTETNTLSGRFFVLSDL